MMLPAVMFYSMIFCLQCCKQLDLLYGGSWDGKQRRLSYFSGSYMEDPADKWIPCDGGTGFCSVCDGSRSGFEVKRRGQGFFIWIGV